ncbi:uncharacterized protein N7511_010572 [Penicillium nucicola]|uniref:uncharacterized protein n=1 Tax=Penicillium nucicola TaxID=1850975 RepID=UPI00254548FF|nr:uncharacterized protein N7511_010572 [Penicillium nucicola]KAJ5748876.1 hypothetical protein N7511_010572 [Penicillium nucicola]
MAERVGVSLERRVNRGGRRKAGREEGRVLWAGQGWMDRDVQVDNSSTSVKKEIEVGWMELERGEEEWKLFTGGQVE